MTYWRSPITNWDETTELPPIVRDYCKHCGWHNWGPAATYFMCGDCLRNQSAWESPAYGE